MDDVVEINGVKYKKVESVEGGSVESFGRHLPAVQKALGKLLTLENEVFPLSEILVAEKVGVIDPANVCLVEALSDRAKVALQPFIYKLNEKIPHLKFEPVKKGVKYSTEYLAKIINLFSTSDDEFLSVRFSDDYPLQVENKDWRVILAPRVEGDE